MRTDGYINAARFIHPPSASTSPPPPAPPLHFLLRLLSSPSARRESSVRLKTQTCGHLGLNQFLHEFGMRKKREGGEWRGCGGAGRRGKKVEGGRIGQHPVGFWHAGGVPGLPRGRIGPLDGEIPPKNFRKAQEKSSCENPFRFPCCAHIRSAARSIYSNYILECLIPRPRHHSSVLSYSTQVPV